MCGESNVFMHNLVYLNLCVLISIIVIRIVPCKTEYTSMSLTVNQVVAIKARYLCRTRRVGGVSVLI